MCRTSWRSRPNCCSGTCRPACLCPRIATMQAFRCGRGPRRPPTKPGRASGADRRLPDRGRRRGHHARHHPPRPSRRVGRRARGAVPRAVGEIETAHDEARIRILGPGAALRSKTPDLVFQEIDGLMLARCAGRRLIHEAAEKAGEDPDRLSFVHAVRVMRRRIINPGAFPPRGRPA